MPDIPSRVGFAALADRVNAVVPAVTLGFARRRDDERVSVLYSSSYRFGQYILATSDLPDVLLPEASEPVQAGGDTIQANPQRPVEWQLIAGGVQQVVSTRVPDLSPATRFWIGVSQGDALSDGQMDDLSALAETSAGLWNAGVSSEETVEQLRRLELAAGLLPALVRVLDVREVFDRLSVISQAALPHDMLTLGLFNDDLSAMTMYARTGQGSDLGRVFPQPYPAAVTQAWEFDIIDDRMQFPHERDRPPTKLGMRSTLRLPFRFEDRVIGGLAFHALEAARYTSADVAVGRRLADHVAAALSHRELAERLAEEARRGEELRARMTSLELLDELLITLIDSGGLAGVFERMCAIARRVLPHEAAALVIHLPDGRHGRVYAGSGSPTGLPDTIEIPEEHLRNSSWEHDIFDDVSRLPGPNYDVYASLGLRSLLRVPIRLEGRFIGELVFSSTARAAFKPADILIARRIGDRLTVTLARDRELEASRRVDEATARASRLEARVHALTEELDSRTGYRTVGGESAQWRQVLMQATQVAATDTTVLLLGESGTGKEVVARFLHRGSPRRDGPFIVLNCAALAEQLLEAELFGYERDAYTGATQSKPGQLEQASGGTLFLDEVAEMSPSTQAKFLRLLQEREFQRLGGTRVMRTDARVIAATNRDLRRLIASGQFREDLYYRLNVFAIQLPPLRERPADILPLSEAFLLELGRVLGRPPGGISREARQLLVEYHWPGNVRELRNILERAAILCDGGLITAAHLGLNPVAPPIASPNPAPPAEPVAAPVSARATEGHASGATEPSSVSDLQAMERAMIEQALQTARFNKSKAARALGLTRHQLYIRMRKYGFE